MRSSDGTSSALLKWGRLPVEHEAVKGHSTPIDWEKDIWGRAYFEITSMRKNSLDVFSKAVRLARLDVSKDHYEGLVITFGSSKM